MKDLIQKELKRYNWEMDYTLNEISTKFYNVSFPKCVIEFYINNKYKSIECSIFVDNNEYSIFDALRFNNLRTGYVYDNHSDVEIFSYLEQYILILNKELLKYIKYDFSWCKRANRSLGLG